MKRWLRRIECWLTTGCRCSEESYPRCHHCDRRLWP